MFPTLNHFLQYAFGFELPFNLPSYGIIFAFSLFLSAFVLYLELKRKNREGTIKMPVVEKKRNGEIATSVVKPVNLVADFLFLAVIWGIIGSKVFHILENASEFAKDPAGMIFSFQGFSFY
ncbi:MAG: hypothetical protein KKA07_15840, partial [Bacteroidetes bacterium]|nr:hypothetical protein [Bacteroidota bacterium]